MNLLDYLHCTAAESPDALAFVDHFRGKERRTTFATFERLAAETAARLRMQGVGEEHRVLVLVPMCLELYVTLAAVWWLGATVVFIDPGMGRRRIQQACETIRLDALIGVSKARWLLLLHRSLRRIPGRFFWHSRGIGAHRLTLSADTSALKVTSDATSVTPNHAAIHTFTSGTTGRPKLITRTHGLLSAQYTALKAATQLEPGEVDLATLPVFALTNIAAGVTTVLPDADMRRPGGISPGPVLTQMETLGVTRCTAAPAFWHCLAEGMRDRAAAGVSLRKLFVGGAPVFPRTLRLLADRFSHADPTVVYGATEAEPIAAVRWSAMTDADRTGMTAGGGLLVGMPVPEIQLRICAPTQNSETISTEASPDALPSNAIGEIVVRGPHVVSAISANGPGDPAKAQDLSTATWHRTGDAGRLDEHGRLWLFGRCGDAMTIEGRMVYPYAVECAATERFDVPLAACLPGPRGLAAVLPKELPAPPPTAGPVTLAGHCMAEILRIRLPVDARHNSKIDRRRLRQVLGKRYRLPDERRPQG